MSFNEIQNIQPEKCKVAVIRESLVKLTGGFIPAVILNQFLYWTERVKDYDQYAMEETARAESLGNEVNIPLQRGWIWKTAEQLSEETMLGLGKKAILKYIQGLLDSGWIERRNNPDPNYKWDRTYQYRVNVAKIQIDLFVLGYVLENYRFKLDTVKVIEIVRLIAETSQEAKKKLADFEMKLQGAEKKLQNIQTETAIPETTPETTPETIYPIIVNDEHDGKTTQWATAIELLKEEIPPAKYEMWFQEIQPIFKDEVLTIVCPNDFVLSWIKQRYHSILFSVIQLSFSGITTIHYQLSTATTLKG